MLFHVFFHQSATIQARRAAAPIIASMVYKACHLPIELEHKARFDLKQLNFDFKTAGENRILDTRVR
jgi:hypothetical protein